MSKPQTVTVECGGIPFVFRLSDWQRFQRTKLIPPDAREAVRTECVTSGGCHGCPVNEKAGPCLDRASRAPCSRNWGGPRDPKRCAELLGMRKGGA